MDLFDVFTSVRGILYIGNYKGTISEIESTEVNEDDFFQVVRRYFYLFLSYLEDNKQTELNSLLLELKDNKDLKMYYNIFRFFTIFYLKAQFKADVLEKMYSDIVSVENPTQILQPAVYILSLIFYEIDDRDRFLNIIKCFPNDIELLSIKAFYLLKMNRIKEAELVIKTISEKETESIPSQLLSLFLSIIKGNNIDNAVSILNNIKNNSSGGVTPKLLNLIGLTVMYKGKYVDALKPLLIGIETCEKKMIANSDLACLFVNSITCYRNLGMDDKVREYEEKLRNSFPGNRYFLRVKAFEDEIDSIIKVN